MTAFYNILSILILLHSGKFREHGRTGTVITTSVAEPRLSGFDTGVFLLLSYVL